MKKSLKTRPAVKTLATKRKAVKKVKETATFESPWKDGRTKTVAAEEQHVGLNNPFAELFPDKIDPDKPPLSPVEKKPMLAATIGPAKGPAIQVWVAPGERIVLPRLASKDQ